MRAFAIAMAATLVLSASDGRAEDRASTPGSKVTTAGLTPADGSPINVAPGSAEAFRDCDDPKCPAMVMVPASPASFKIGSPPSEPGRLASEEQLAVSIPSFAIGKYEVSVDEYMACVSAQACRWPEWLEPGGQHNIDTGSGVTYKSIAAQIRGGGQPVVGVSWNNAADYASWLSRITGQPYRLPSEAEWEYAARAGSTAPYWWGSEVKPSGEVMACCRGCGSDLDGMGFYPAKSFKPNPWGLHNVHGNVWEWVADDFCESYAGGPSDGSAREHATCGKQISATPLKVFRGGSCFYDPQQMRAAMRLRNYASFRNMTVGFRVARSLSP